MGIAIEGIADYEYADAVRYFVPADGRVRYYIDRTGSTQGVRPTSSEVSIVDATLKYLDSITGVAIEEVADPSAAQVTIFKASPGYYGSGNTVGRTEIDASGIKVSWVDQGSLDWREFTTIQHEIGHLFGLKHPYDDGWNPAYDRDDTVMSYNAEYYSVNSFSDSDKLAMKSIWGEDTKEFVPGRGTHNGTVFADEFYLKTFDGYGEDSADIINGFSIANGDKFQFATSAMGWDESKNQYRLLTTSNSFKYQKVKKRNGKVKWRKVMGNDLNTANKWDDTNTAIYNTSTGELFTDNNGSAYGLGNGGLVAVFTDKPALSYDSMSWVTG